MKNVVCVLVLIAGACFLAGCAETGQDSANAAKEISKEIPKSDSSVPDMPEPPGGIPRGEKGHAVEKDGK